MTCKPSPFFSHIFLKLFTLTFFIYLYSPVNFAKTYSLKELVDYALFHSPDLQSNQTDLEMSQLKIKNAFAAFFPVFDISTSQGLSHHSQYGASESQWVNELKFMGVEKFFDNGASWTQYKMAKKDQDKYLVEVDKQKAQISLTIIKEYFSYSFATKMEQVQKFQQELIQKQFSSIEHQYTQGIKTSSDYLRMKAKLQRAVLTTSDATNVKNKSLIELQKLIGLVPTNEEFKIQEDLQHDVDIKKISTTVPSVDNQYAIKLAGIAKESSALNVSLTERKYWPEILVESQFNYTRARYLEGQNTFINSNDNNTEMDHSNRFEWTALLTLKWNMWDTGILKRNVQISRLESLQKEQALSKTRLETGAEMKALMIDIEQKKSNFLLNKELVELEKKNYLSLDKEYKSGKATFLDLVYALNDYTSAEESFYRNLYDLKSALALYSYYQGTLSDYL